VDNELEVIRNQMEEKRASLADKLEALESQVKETVQGATAEVSHIVDEVKSTVNTVTSGVQETVSTVKETLTEGVQETVETVKQTFNVNDHIRRNPWLAMGGSVAAGFAAGYLLGPSGSGGGSWEWQRRQETPAEPAPSWAPTADRFAGTPAAQPAASSSSSESTFGPAVSALEEAGMDALRKVRELAVGTLMGVLGQVAANSLPPFLKDEVTKLTTDLTTKLGGKVLDLSDVFKHLQGEGGNGNTGEEARAGFAGNDRSAQRANGREG